MKIVSPQYVRPFVRRQKNDGNDAEAICTAIQQPDMRFVPTRSLEQQDIQALHRARQRLVNHRTAVAFVLAKSIAGFSNADEGHLFVGVKEDKDSDTIEIIGIDAELNKLKDSTIDGYRRMIVDDVVMRFLPKAFLQHINRHLRIDFPIINGVTASISQTYFCEIQ